MRVLINQTQASSDCGATNRHNAICCRASLCVGLRFDVVLLVLLLSLLRLQTHATSSEEPKSAPGEYVYAVDNGKATITGYSGTERNLSIPSVIDGYPVIGIGDQALSLNNLRSVIIPEGVEYIGKRAFTNSTELTSASLPESLVYIGESAFAVCQLDSITIPPSVLVIGDRAFYSTALTSVRIPGSVAIIGDAAFSSCHSLKSVSLSYGIMAIGNEAFTHCSALSAIRIPGSVTSIGDNAFFDCTGLLSVTISDSVISIGENVFTRCTSLQSFFVGSNNPRYSSDSQGLLYSKGKTILVLCPPGKTGSVSIPGSVSRIGAYAFSDCKGLSSVNMPDSVASIGEGAFSGCEGLVSITLPGSIVAIGEYAFQGCGLESIKIPYGVESIGRGAFGGAKIRSLAISASVKDIGEDAFSFCYYLAEIAVDQNNQFFSTDEQSILYDKNRTRLILCYNKILTSVNIPSTVIEIGGNAFYSCEKLSSVLLPDGAQSIGEGAFRNCSELSSIFLPDSITYIGDYSFEACGSLASIIMPRRVTSIGKQTFSRCRKLTYISLPDGLKSIGENAFSNCDSLISIDLPDKVERIDDMAFFGCDSLTSIVVPGNVAYIGESAFAHCTRLASANIPDSVSRIERSTFELCESLTLEKIPSSVKSIGYKAFQYCYSITAIALPSSVESIDDMAFANCANLGHVTFYNPSTEFQAGTPDTINPGYGAPTFVDCGKLSTVYGYPGSTAAVFAKSWGFNFVPIIKLLLNGNELCFDVPAQLVGGRAAVPMRGVFEGLGAEVAWDEVSMTATASIDGISITMQIGNPAIELNGEKISLETAPQILNGRTLVPLQAVTMSLDADVIWDAETNIVDIQYPRPSRH